MSLKHDLLKESKMNMRRTKIWRWNLDGGFKEQKWRGLC